MLILGLLGMYFDAAVVFFTISSLLFRMAMAMLCPAWVIKIIPPPIGESWISFFAEESLLI